MALQEHPRYLEQYNRMLRWYRRVEKISTGDDRKLSTWEALDEVHAFFQSCYHLRDWLIHDPEEPILKKEVDNHIDDSEALSMASVICNRTKHLELTREQRTDKTTNFSRNSVKVIVGSGFPITVTCFKIADARNEYDAFEIATKCIRAWEQFFKEKDLLKVNNSDN